jgi:hypothetical protein
MKILGVSSLAVFLVGCAAMEAPEEEISGDVARVAAASEAPGRTLSYQPLATGLPDEGAEPIGIQAISDVSVSPSSIAPGATATVTVTISPAAPTGTGAGVLLSSSDPSVLPVPGFVIVAGGATSATFNVTAGSVTASTVVTITATQTVNAVTTSDSVGLTIKPPHAVSSLTLTPASVNGGGEVQGEVTLEAPAPAGGTEVALASNDPAVAQPATPTVTVAAGSSTAIFTVLTFAVGADTTATISASSAGVTVSATLTVLADPTPDPVAIVDDEGCRTNTLPPNDDGSTGAVALPFPVNFFGTTYTHLFVNNNGNVTFQAPLGTFTPFRLAANTPPIIAPFFADVDTRGAGSDPVRYSFGAIQFGNRPAFCVNWINVGYYAGHTDKLNSFQLLLIDQGGGDFDIMMNYGRVEWETGDASGGSNGFGGTSAGAGYSAGNGQAAAFFEFPGSLVNGALLDTNTTTGLTQTRSNSQTQGRHVFAVRNGAAPVGGSIAGDVTIGATPLPSAPVQVCPAAGGQCLFVTQTGSQGHYIATGLPPGDYLVTAFPPAGTFVQQRTVGPVTLAANQTLEVDVVLEGPVGLPAGGSLSPSRLGPGGVPSVFLHDPLDLGISGCPGGTATYAVLRPSGTTIVSGAMIEAPAGRYVAQIPPLSPNVGPAQIAVTIQCPDGTQENIEFDIYIDPSGIVRTLSGVPVRDAVVTLFRSDGPTGPFVQVPHGSAIMSPSNRANPDQTNAEGYFRWDVISGYYIVRAQRQGCTSPTGGPFFETDVLPVPPPALDLDLRLDCPELEDTTPPVSIASASPAPGPGGSYNGSVTVQIAATDDDSGVEEIGYLLSGEHVDSALVTGDVVEIALDAPGSTTLTWFARDRAGNVEALQSIEIRISLGPTLAGCDDVTAVATPGLGGAHVSYEVTAHDDAGGSVPVTCDVASGSYFATGESVAVTCTAADSAGNEAACTFLVQVQEPATCEAPDPRAQDYWRSQCNYRGADGTPPDPVLTSEILQSLLDRVEPDLQAVCETGESTCQALNPYPFYDGCEQACQQYAALLLNVASARVPSVCCTNEGTAAEAAALVGDLIAAGQCAEANTIAYDVNRGCVFSCAAGSGH